MSTTDAVIAALTDAIAALHRASEAHHDACDTCAGGPFADSCPTDDAIYDTTCRAEAAVTLAGYVAPELHEYEGNDQTLPVLLD